MSEMDRRMLEEEMRRRTMQQAAVQPEAQQMQQPETIPETGRMMGDHGPMTAEDAIKAGREGMKQRKIGPDELKKAMDTLIKYKNGKQKLDERLVNNEKWWEGRAWNTMQEQGNPLQARRPTMWLFNVIMGKHADMVAAYPEPVILPREDGDEEEAKQLTSILPVVLEQNDFAEVYSNQAWQKNKSGIAVYGVFWDSKKLNGLGDISICAVDPVSIFWEPGIEDIQKSRNVFSVSMQDRDMLESAYPQMREANGVSPIQVKRYSYEDNVDDAGKAAVIDWYYHTWENGKKKLQYCKFCGNTVLYSSEDDGDGGWYADGDYPFVVDNLFPKKGTIAGNGYIDIGKNAQETIDLLDQACTVSAMASAYPRYFRRSDCGVNVDQFMDFRKPLVDVEGNLTDLSLIPITTPGVSAGAVSMMQNKIEELKQTTGNQDVLNGGTSGTTAASAIAALQESAGRSSADGIRGTYRAYTRVLLMVIERIRQFYDAPRKFRIMGENGQMEFMAYSNAGIKENMQMIPGIGEMMTKPEFDIAVNAQKQNAYSKMAQNELALQLLNAGVFNAQMAEQSLMLLEAMDFNGKDKIIQRLQDYQTMQQQLAMWQQMAMQLANTYEPATAQQMAQTIMQGGGMPVGTTGEVDEDRMNLEKQAESAITRNARERSANASQPG